MRLVDKYTQYVKSYDKQLLCKEFRGERGEYLAVYREHLEHEKIYIGEGMYLGYYQPVQHLVFCLTHDWRRSGFPVEWGFYPLMAKLKASDIHANDRIVEDLLKEHEKVDASKKRKNRNNTEAFLGDYRREFAKKTNGINTALMSKKTKITE